MIIAQRFTRFLMKISTHSLSHLQSRMVNDQFRANPSTYSPKRTDPWRQRCQTSTIGRLMGKYSFNMKSLSIDVATEMGPIGGGTKTSLRLRSMSTSHVFGQRGDPLPAVIVHRIVKPSRVITSVRQHNATGPFVTQHFAGHGFFIDIKWHYTPDRNSPVLRTPGMNFVSLGHASGSRSGFGIAVLGVWPDSHDPSINERQLGKRIMSGKMLMQVWQDGVTPLSVDSFTKLRNGGELSWAKVTRVIPSIAGPAQRSIMPGRPNVHRHDQPIRIGRTASPSRKGSIRAANGLVNYFPHVVVHSASPCS